MKKTLRQLERQFLKAFASIGEEPPPDLERVRSKGEPLKPFPCGRCGADARGRFALIEGKVRCLHCTVAELDA